MLQGTRRLRSEVKLVFCHAALLSFALHLQAAQPTLPSAPDPQPSAQEAASIANGTLRTPILLYQVAPQFTEAARRKRLSGNVELSVIVDAEGKPRKVTVRHGLGFGLDEEATAAVKQYRWKPATRNGNPVAMEIPVFVNFQIF